MDPFVEAHRPQWERLDDLLRTVDQSGLKALSPPELGELGRLYRQAATHLAQARAERRDPRLVDYLNLLVGRGHAVIYRHRRGPGFSLRRFFAAEFPQTFRRTFRFTAVSVALSVAGASLAYVLVVADRGWVEHVAPKGLPDAVEGFLAKNQPAGAYFGEAHGALGSGPFSALLWTHNLQVGVTAFAGGLTACALTVWALAANGMMLGSFLAVGTLHSRQLDCWAIIAPHGALELSAVFICGGAGLMLGYSVINPGDLRRRDAIALAARESVKLVLGVVPVFLAAGCIEGTISPISTGLFRDSWVRVAFGLGTWLILACYLAAGGKSPPSPFSRRVTPSSSPSAPDSG